MYVCMYVKETNLLGLGMCRWPLRAPTPLYSILWPIIDPIFELSHFLSIYVFTLSIL